MVPFTIATGTMTHAQNVFIRVHTDAGFYGVGECSAFPMIVGETQETCLVMAKEFARLWKGKDALDIPARLQQLHDFTAGNGTIKSAFDMALYDITAKNAGLPLYQFLGGARRKVESDITIGIAEPVVMAEKASEFKKSGATILKIKLGKDAKSDVERIRQIREAAGNEMKIRVDDWIKTLAIDFFVGIFIPNTHLLLLFINHPLANHWSRLPLTRSGLQTNVAVRGYPQPVLNDSHSSLVTLRVEIIGKHHIDATVFEILQFI